MFMRLVVFTALAAAIISLTEQRSSRDAGKCKSYEVEDGKQRIALGSSKFAFDLQQLAAAHAADELGNIILSPLSITGALSLLLVGSYGSTYKEIADRLGFFDEISCSRSNHQTFGGILTDLIKYNRDRQQVYLANGLFITQDYCVRPQYQYFVRTVYGADITPINFGSPVSKDIVNSWVSERTLGRIENVLQEVPSPNTKLIVANTIYFNSEWLHHFAVGRTKRMLFMPNKSKPGENILVNMMVTVAEFAYTKSAENGCHMVALPYKDGKTTFYAIMPTNSTEMPLKHLVARFDYNVLESLISQLQTLTVTVALPKMNLNYRVDAKFLLRNMGITSLFSPARANLALLTSGQCDNDSEDKLIFTRFGSHIVDEDERKQTENSARKERRNAYFRLENSSLFVDELVHDVRMNITEMGTEAAAATIAYAFKTRQAIFRADEPFMFLIRDEETKLILFTGIIFKPNPHYNFESTNNTN